ncbi:MAG: single-stranded-DNA-specific exonuclease RecJ [Paludibacteraceae bacterium]|nr:single-stranded-DNA-specific exonuclease RecJ [Paludibacteraceae bacterium]
MSKQYKWIVNELDAGQKKTKETLRKQLGINPTLCGLLAARGIDSVEAAKDFFNPSLDQIHDPFLMNDMDKAVERLDEAMLKQEKILVYGDYDVDGTTAVALVYTFLQNFHAKLDFYIPDRNDEGYGVSYKGIDYAVAEGIKLIIVLDCGIKAIEKVKYAKEHGVDIIICDHHNPDDTLPDAVAVLDPKRTDSTYPYGHLSGCGVGFKLMQAYAQRQGIPFETLVPLLDLLAVSIASDIVPISGENRVLMHYGLEQINHNPRIGIQAILDVCDLHDKNVTVSDIVFKIGPRINASGRMNTGRVAVELLISKDLAAAQAKSAEIDAYNNQRKDLDKQTTVEAMEQIEHTEGFLDDNAIVVYNKDWNKGVIGIVASRLSEKYFRPTVVMTESNGFATGSSRSISGFDIYRAIDSCRDLLENFGGHMYAAGLTLKVENIDAFRKRFNAYIRDNMTDDQRIPKLEADAVLTFREIDATFLKILKRFAPFGPENMKPVFVSRGLLNAGGSRCVGANPEKRHLKLDLIEPESGARMSGIAFGLADYEAPLLAGQPIDICYTLEENTFNGRTTTQLMVKDIQTH